MQACSCFDQIQLHLQENCNKQKTAWQMPSGFLFMNSIYIKPIYQATQDEKRRNSKDEEASNNAKPVLHIERRM